MKTSMAILVCSVIGLTPALVKGATISLDTIGSSYTQDFSSLAGSGTSSVLPAGWTFSESGSAANTTYRAGTGSLNTGDTYSFGATGSSDRAFGILRSGSLISMIGAEFRNNLGLTVGGLEISYFGEQWRLGALGRGADQLIFEYSLDASSLTTGNWTSVGGLAFSSPVTTGTVGALDGNADANRTLESATITGLDIAPGATFWLRWSEVNPSGGADGLAVDDFSILADQLPLQQAVPEVLPLGFSAAILFALLGFGRRSAARPAMA